MNTRHLAMGLLGLLLTKCPVQVLVVTTFTMTFQNINAKIIKLLLGTVKSCMMNLLMVHTDTINVTIL